MGDRHSGKTITRERSRNTKCSNQGSKSCLEQAIHLLYSLELHFNEFTSDYVVPRTEEVSSNDDI